MFDLLKKFDMKKLLLLLLLMCLNQIINAQKESIVKCLPQYTQGYLVLKNTSEIKYFDVVILKRVYDKDGTYNDRKIEGYTVIGKNFTVISDEYTSSPNHLVALSVYYSNGVVTHETTPISSMVPNFDTDYDSVSRTWLCNGLTYSFLICQYVHKNGGSSFFKVEPGLVYNNAGQGSYCYQYFSPGQYQNFINNLSNIMYTSPGGANITSREYYNLVSSNDLIIGTGKIIQLQNNNPSVHYYDGQNNPITDTYLFGIRKTLGPWSGYSGNSECLEKIIASGSLAQSLSHAISIVNSNHQYLSYCDMEDLDCNTTHNSFPVVKPWSHKTDGYLQIKDTVVYIPGLFSMPKSCGINTNENPITAISISSVSSNNGQLFNMTASDLIDENGDTLNLPVHLNPGLYTFGYQLNDGSYVHLIGEVMSDVNTTNYLSNYLSITIFPVPITENYFNINFNATKDMNFNYTLYDFKGNIIFSHDYKIANGKPVTVVIKPEKEIPTGILVNIFRFKDGSQQSILTVKN